MSALITSPIVGKKRKNPTPAPKKSSVAAPKKKPKFIQRSGKLQPKELIRRKTVSFNLYPIVYTLLADNTYNEEVHMPKPISLKDFFFKNRRTLGVLELSEQDALTNAYIEQKIDACKIQPDVTYEYAIQYLIKFLRTKLKSLETSHRRGTSINGRFFEEAQRGILERLCQRFENYLISQTLTKTSQEKRLTF
tara:strand:+ start:370 stop:948 length:579 start_codon:yes stop_codon:yes gene_type:complete